MSIFNFLGAGPNGRDEALAQKDGSNEALAIIESDIRNLALRISGAGGDLEKAKIFVDEYLASLEELGGEQFFYTALGGLLSPNIRISKTARYMLIRYARETRFFAFLGTQETRKQMMRAKTKTGQDKLHGYYDLLASKEVQAYLNSQRDSGTVSNDTRNRADASLRAGPSSVPNLMTWPAPLDSRPSIEMRAAADRVHQIMRWEPPRPAPPVAVKREPEDSILSNDTRKKLDSMPASSIQGLILKHLTTITHDPQKITTAGTPEEKAYKTLLVLLRYVEVTEKATLVQRALADYGMDAFDKKLFGSFSSGNSEYMDILLKLQDYSGNENIEKVTGFANSEIRHGFSHSKTAGARA